MPGGHAVRTNFSVGYSGSQKCECCANALAKSLSRNFAQLRLGVVKIENVDRFDSQIVPAAVELIGKVGRGHAVASGGDFFRAKDSAFQEFMGEVFVCISRHFAIGG